MDPTKRGLAILDVIFYAIVVLPAIYCLIMHGKPSITGWMYPVILCALRPAGNGMLLDEYKEGTLNLTAMVLNSTGLSPLLGAGLGILHEAPKGIVITHAVTLAGVALAASSANDPSRLKIGMVLFTVGWILIMAAVALSHTKGRPFAGQRLPDEHKLLWTVTVAVPLTGVRLIYSLITDFATSNIHGGSLVASIIFGTCLNSWTLNKTRIVSHRIDEGHGI
ncbi:hypothetical protein BDW66DRAFT_163252 [Aspergillus desertorum]